MTRSSAPARSADPFFRDGQTKAALIRLAGVEHLVIYCGAGVTIDQTGMGWVELLRRVFETHSAGVDTAARLMNWPQVASGLYERQANKSGSTREVYEPWLENTLRSLLYPLGQDVAWRSGFLTDSVAKLALVAASEGRTVTIVSTNYDTHLESRIAALQEGEGAQARVQWTAPENAHSTVLQPGCISIVYLHGRIPQGAASSGRIVLTEEDYVETRELSRSILMDLLLRDEVGLLVLGSSLSDPPMIDGLAETSEGAQGPRIALFPVLPTGLQDATDYPDALKLFKSRGQHLGLEVLCPDFLFQVPEFCKELGLAIASADAEQYLEGPLRYGARLDAWWRKCEESLPSYETVGSFMSASLSTVLGALQLRHVTTTDAREGDEELYRLDLWLRETPNRRELVQWGSSIGSLTDPRLYKREPLDLRSKHATVRGFMLGQPTLLGLEDLGMEPQEPTLKWKTFLVVPVFDRIELLEGGETSNVPVGAACLCGTLQKDQSGINADPGRLSEVVELMRDMATQLRSAGT